MSTPFPTADAAFLWTMAAIRDRNRGVVSHSERDAAPITPDEVIRCLDTLYRARRIDLFDAKILRKWGDRGRAPDPKFPAEVADWAVWRGALDKLSYPLRQRGIVASSLKMEAVASC